MITFVWRKLATAAFLGGLLTGVSPAFADTDILENVTFGDGGTLTGSFMITNYGYLGSIALTTTAGTTTPSEGNELPGFAYSSGQLSPNMPPASMFDFYATTPGWTLVLDLNSALGYGYSNDDALVVGSVVGSTLSGSYEYCANTYGCQSFADGSYRLVTAGEVYAPEPATLGILGFGTLLLPALRRARVSVAA